MTFHEKAIYFIKKIICFVIVCIVVWTTENSLNIMIYSLIGKSFLSIVFFVFFTVGCRSSLQLSSLRPCAQWVNAAGLDSPFQASVTFTLATVLFTTLCPDVWSIWQVLEVLSCSAFEMYSYLMNCNRIQHTFSTIISSISIATAISQSKY